LHEDEIDNFFDKFDPKDIIKCLCNELKSIATLEYGDEQAWKLGRIFGDTSKKYSADIKAYSWFKTSNNLEKGALLNFISGYWDQTQADINTLILISQISSKAVSNKEWSEDLILAAIDAVGIGYANNKQIIHNHLENTNEIKETLQLFREYLSNIADNSEPLSSHCQSLQELLKRCLEIKS